MSKSGIKDVEIVSNKIKSIEETINESGNLSLVGCINNIINTTNELSECCQAKSQSDTLYLLYESIVNNTEKIYSLYDKELKLLSNINDLVINAQNILDNSDGTVINNGIGLYQSNGTYHSYNNTKTEKSAEYYNQYGVYNSYNSAIYNSANNKIWNTVINWSTIAPTEGLGKFGEALIDGFVFCGAFIANPIGNAILKAKNKDKRNVIMEHAREYIQEKNCEGMFDDFFSQTSFGKDIVKNSYGYKTGRKIGNVVGYAAPTVLLGVVTSGSSIPLQALSTGATVAVTSYGKSSEKAWDNGASTMDGAKYAAIKGTMDGGIAATSTFVSNVVPITNPVAKTVFDAGTNVEGSIHEPITDAALETIYSDNYQDANGNIHYYTSSDTFMDRWRHEFEDDGGIKNVGESVMEGALVEGINHSANSS